MRNFLIGAFLVLLVVFGVRYCENRNQEQDKLEESTALLQQQIKNVGKLVVTEGTFLLPGQVVLPAWALILCYGLESLFVVVLLPAFCQRGRSL